MNAIARLRRRLAMLLWPAIDTARGKRHLEAVARECGASIAVAKRIAATYFKNLHNAE